MSSYVEKHHVTIFQSHDLQAVTKQADTFLDQNQNWEIKGIAFGNGMWVVILQKMV